MAQKMKYYFNADTAKRLGDQLGIDGTEYATWVAPRVDDLEILDRVTVFAQGLHVRLPQDYTAAVHAVVDKLGPELREGEGYFNHSFHLWPVSRFIEMYGLDNPELSLMAIEALTRAFTGEWAVRPYLERYPDLTMAKVHAWAKSDSHNVRRLASEGIRPRLPWARVHAPYVDDPSPIIPVLDALVADASLFVRKSVANNLNDITRTHPDLALETARRWSTTHPTAETKWLIERGVRSLIKQGHPEALALAGFAQSDDVVLRAVDFPDRVAVGDAATLSVELENTGTSAHELLVEYRIHFLKKHGARRPTVFRVGRFTLAPGETRLVSKSHVFRITGTRTYYPGPQAISVVVNGVESAPRQFELTPG